MDTEHIENAIIRVSTAIEKSFVGESYEREFNVSEAIQGAGRALNAIANGIVPQGAIPSNDETGGRVGSLTEAFMGMTSAMCRIASAIDRVADAIEESQTNKQ